MNLTVVMCTYNGGKYLKRQIESILNQTRQPDEFIVCDDCSTDDTLTILKKYQEAGKLKYHVNAQQLGLIENFRKAVSLAAVDSYVALSDQDDEWLPEKLERSLALIKTLDGQLPCLVHTDLILVDDMDRILNSSFRNELGQSNFQHNLQSLLFGNFVTGCTVLMNPQLKAYFEHMPAQVKFHDAWLALCAFTFGETAEITAPMIKYRKHGSNLSIMANTKPRNRYTSTADQIIKAIRGNDDFLALQFQTVGLFYQQYQQAMTSDKKILFEGFLKLKDRSYFTKKLAFRKMVNRFPVR